MVLSRQKTTSKKYLIYCLQSENDFFMIFFFLDNDEL